MVFSPRGDLGVIAAEQNVWDFLPAETFWPSVLRKFQRLAVAEAFDLGRLFTAKHTRNQPDNRVNHHHRRQLAARQHIVADESCSSTKSTARSS